MGHCRKNMISIFLTNVCNLQCKYCYLGKKNNNTKKVIDINFAKRGIDDFFNSGNPPAVRFFSEGEPTLAFKEMVEIKEYAALKSKNKAIFELQTNGVFSGSIAEWIADNMDIVYISMDGIPEHNDALRVFESSEGSSDIITKNIEILKKNPKLQLGVRATISSINNGKQKEMIDYFHSLGIKIIFADLIFSSLGTTDTPLTVDYKKFIDKFVEARNYAEKIGMFYSTMFASNFDEEVKYACRSCLPTPHLTVDGYVTCCDMCTNGSSPLKELIYGRYNKERGEIVYYPEAIDKIRQRHPDNIKECKTCEIKYHCAGACLGECLNETGDFFGVKEEACNAIKYLWDALGRKTIQLPYLHP